MTISGERDLPDWVEPLLEQGWQVAFVKKTGAAFSFRLTNGHINLTHSNDPSGWSDLVGPVKGGWGWDDAEKVAKELGLEMNSRADALFLCAKHAEEVAKWMTSFRRQWLLLREAFADFREDRRIKKRAGVL